jgi:hypothetical protein
MKIRLDEEDIRALRSYQRNPGNGQNGYNAERLEAIGLLEECQHKDAKEAQKRAKSSFVKFVKSVKKLDLKNLNLLKDKTLWDEAYHHIGQIYRESYSINAKGLRLTDTGKQLLSDINSAVRQAKWLVTDKSVEIEVNV